MPENEAKRCFMGSLNYWSHKTLESNMSLTRYRDTTRPQWALYIPAMRARQVPTVAHGRRL